MAQVDQAITPTRTYSPFEGMSEAQRLVTAVPRGMIRFSDTTALAAKPVNDNIRITWTCSLPLGFAYVVSSLHIEIAVDTAADYDKNARFRIFNGVPNAPLGNTASHLVKLVLVGTDAFSDPFLIGTADAGSIRDSYPSPLVHPARAAGMSAILQVINGSDTVQAAGTTEFHLSFYQYELNQAVRFPLNFPLPVGVR